jgi:hypothetical protein
MSRSLVPLILLMTTYNDIQKETLLIDTERKDMVEIAPQVRKS